MPYAIAAVAVVALIVIATLAATAAFEYMMKPEFEIEPHPTARGYVIVSRKGFKDRYVDRRDSPDLLDDARAAIRR